MQDKKIQACNCLCVSLCVMNSIFVYDFVVFVETDCECTYYNLCLFLFLLPIELEPPSLSLSLWFPLGHNNWVFGFGAIDIRVYWSYNAVSQIKKFEQSKQAVEQEQQQQQQQL